MAPVDPSQATFRTLSESGYTHNSQAGPGLLVTGKGYPDLNTRLFLYLTALARADIPMFCLVDFDPDGIHIFQCYKHGPNSVNHEDDAKVPELRWLGVKSKHVLQACVEPDGTGRLGVVAMLQTSGRTLLESSQQSQHSASSGRSAASYELVSSLTMRDRKMAVSSLRKLGREGRLEADATDIRRELQVMLMLNYKAEIQAVDDMGDLASWLDDHLSCS